MNTTAILEALYELGFKTEEIEGVYVFEHDGLRLLYNPENDDEVFFRLSAPCVYEVEDDENRMVTLDMINEVNCRIKYSKTMLQGDSVWVSYETRIFDGMEAEEMVRFGVLIVHATVELFYRKISGMDNPFSEENQENESNEE